MIRLTVNVSNISNVIQIYSYIRVYRSTTSSGGYSSLGYVPLEPDVSTYYYDDLTGTPDYWYEVSYYKDANTESALSDPIKGSDPSLYYDTTYPNEIDFPEADEVIIRKIRRLIGDFKGLDRIYVTDCSLESCTFVEDDGKTILLPKKGWPVYIGLTNSSGTLEEKTTLIDPEVQGYKYLTFSNNLIEGSICNYDIVDIWYYTFKFSDREVYEAYGDAMIPARVPSAYVTQDHLVLQAAIDLLENMTSADMTEDGAQIEDDQRNRYDPSPGLNARKETLARLRAMLDALIKEVIFNLVSSIEGVIVD